MAFIAITKKNGSKTTTKIEMPVNLPAIASDALMISEAAAQAIKSKADDEGKTGFFFRVGIVGGGCSGLSYHFAFEATSRETDKVFEAHGVKICVDPKSLKLIGGSLLDWHDAGMRKEFRLLNGKTGKSCSCGKSFSL